jgi:gas vesicle protein
MGNKGLGFAVGFLFGALAGAVLALLFAPASGEELRGEIGAKGAELKEQMAQAQEQGRIVISDNVRKAQQAVQEAQTRLSKVDADVQPVTDTGVAA